MVEFLGAICEEELRHVLTKLQMWYSDTQIAQSRHGLICLMLTKLNDILVLGGKYLYYRTLTVVAFWTVLREGCVQCAGQRHSAQK